MNPAPLIPEFRCCDTFRQYIKLICEHFWKKKPFMILGVCIIAVNINI